MVLSYYKHHKSYILDINEAQSGEIFFNKKIDRILSTDFNAILLTGLIKRQSPRERYFGNNVVVALIINFYLTSGFNNYCPKVGKCFPAGKSLFIG